MSYIKHVEINKFRAIKQLTLSDLSRINILVGDNNSGKTTFLEAIQLLFVSSDLNAVKRVINQRTILNPSSANFYTSFMKLFNVEQDTNHLDLDIYAETEDGKLEFEIEGKEKEITGTYALSLVSEPSRKKKQEYVPEQASLFTGRIIAGRGENTEETPIKCTSLDRTNSLPAKKGEIQYISSFGHLRYDLLQNIVDNPEYKSLAINILNQFDESIADICYTKEDDGTFLETIITKNGVKMPFSIYGDGIKKILFILNKLFDASDSILLIDEIETGLHKKYYDIMFPIIFALAERLNVQLFIATHSIEAIDAILKYGRYDESDNKADPIKVITFKKVEADDGSRIIARNVSGKYVYENRRAFEFEVRL